MTTPLPAPRANQFTVLPLALALIFPTVHIVLRATPIASDFAYVMLGMPALVLAWLATGIGGLWMVKEAVAAKATRQAVSWGALSAIVLMGMVFLDTVRVYANRAGDLLHLGIWLDHYESHVRAAPDNGRPKLVIFKRGGMIWASLDIVYDASDEIALPAEKQSREWRERAGPAELGCGYRAWHAFGHFY